MIPVLIHAVSIKIEQISHDNTLYDPDTREPYRIVEREPGTLYLQGQVRYNREDDAEWGRGGRAAIGDGHLVFLKHEIENANIKFNVGDKIVKIGKDETEYYVIGIRHGAHYTEEEGPTLLLIDFEDRRNRT